MIHEQIEPFGERREDLRAGLLWHTIRNIWRGANTPEVSLWEYPLLKDLEPEPDEASSFDDMMDILVAASPKGPVN